MPYQWVLAVRAVAECQRRQGVARPHSGAADQPAAVVVAVPQTQTAAADRLPWQLGWGAGQEGEPRQAAPERRVAQCRAEAAGHPVTNQAFSYDEL